MSSPSPQMMVGEDDFKSLLLSSDIFVDKSLLIKEVIENAAKVLLIARPRRWGKSLNMSMLKRFFEIEVDASGNTLPVEKKTNKQLFAGGELDLGLASGRKKTFLPLKIFNHKKIIEEQQGHFPVILFNLKNVKGNNYQEIEDGVKKQVIKLYAKYKYLKKYLEKNSDILEESEKENFSQYFKGNITINDLKNSLCDLSELLYKHFGKKIYLFIDEYDTPINNAYIKFGHQLEEFEKVLDLFRGIFGNALKSNDCLEKGIITGILRIAKANLFSDLNNLTENTLLDEDFSDFYGFTQDEIDELLTKVPIANALEQIKDWYNGYTFGSKVIYNPWSIMQCLAHKGKLDPYWLDSGGTSLVDKVLFSDGIQEDLQSLLEGKGIVKRLYKQIFLGDIENNRELFFSLLVFAGYLNPSLVNNDDENPKYKLTIPNKEVRHIYSERVIGWVIHKLNMTVSDYDDFIGLLTMQKIDQFSKKLNEYLMYSTSYHDLLKEKDYHNLMGGIIAPLTRKYRIESNRESGFGRFDHMLIPRESKNGECAIIIEYKFTEDRKKLIAKAIEGLDQMDHQHYDSQIKQCLHVKKVIKIAMAFCNKEVCLQYKVNSIE